MMSASIWLPALVEASMRLPFTLHSFGPSRVKVTVPFFTGYYADLPTSSFPSSDSTAMKVLVNSLILKAESNDP